MRTATGLKIQLAIGYVPITPEMRHKIKRHATLTNPRRTVDLLGGKKRPSGCVLARILLRQRTIRAHFWEKLVADLVRVECELHTKGEECLCPPTL